MKEKMLVTLLLILGFVLVMTVIAYEQMTPTFIINLTSGLNNVTFNETTSNTSASIWNVTFNATTNKTFYITVPKNSDIIEAKLNLSGYGGFSNVLNYSGAAFHYSAPVIKDGYVYIASYESDGKVYKLNATDMTYVNDYAVGDYSSSTPAVQYGYVYVGIDNGTFFQLNATDMTLVSSYKTNGKICAPVVYGDYVYVQSEDDIVYQFNATNVSDVINSFDGAQQFLYASLGGLAVTEDYVYVIDANGSFYQLNATNVSKIVHTYTVGALSLWGGPVVSEDYVYLPCYGDSILYQFNATNISQLINSYNTGNAIGASPAVDKDYVYVGSGSTLFQLNATNVSIQVSNVTLLGITTYQTPAVSDEYVFSGAYGSVFTMMNRTNLTIIDRYEVSRDRMYAKPAIANGKVYLSAGDVYMFDFGYLSGSTEWPQFRNYPNGSGYSNSTFIASPQNPYLDVTGDGDTEWSYGGNFTQKNNRTDDFSLEIDTYLSTCTVDSNDNCDVPIILHSDYVSRIQVSDINITYDYNTSYLYGITTSGIYDYINHTINKTSVNTSLSGFYVNNTATYCWINTAKKSISTYGGNNYCPITETNNRGNSWTNHSIWDDQDDTTNPIAYSFQLNETYINFNGTAELEVNVSDTDGDVSTVLATIQTSSTSANYSLTSQSSGNWTLGINKTHLGDSEDNSTMINITNIYTNDTCNNALANSSTLNFTYAETNASFSQSTNPLYFPDTQVISGTYESTSSNSDIGANCSLTIGGTTYYDSYPYSFSVLIEDAGSYVWNVTCFNDSYTNSTVQDSFSSRTAGSPAPSPPPAPPPAVIEEEEEEFESPVVTTMPLLPLEEELRKILGEDPFPQIPTYAILGTIVLGVGFIGYKESQRKKKLKRKRGEINV